MEESKTKIKSNILPHDSYMRKIIIFLISTHLIFCILLQIINKVKVTHQGQNHIKVKVKTLHHSNFM